MVIRPARPSDLEACLAIDDTFETEFVWQMDERITPSQISANFRLTRLPRAMRVRDSVTREGLTSSFKNGDTILVADDGAVRGYLDAARAQASGALYIKRLVVSPIARRQGVGAQLLAIVLERARKEKLRAAMLHTSTKAYPAICFLQKHGFAFCGFNDQLYPNRDIALYFAIGL